ncbi:MAG: sigma-70 family RNA polymerase sigma factor [Alicyclobacillus mali]|uniref:sigma-70 family RNA polymerase sigma factor n=1 Tax=Alicyclobacillus mali (ex Roth et al. 2021) TaxID=1123961 RepID=UPI0023F3F0F7|nr:sigma-70 family RNA polymerase sigma factor [Alicyclobacillus mali (ex Roth et al. 2021)]MCL6489030.1 sigma-70 family RNA polymerase sigma factor [Alicyclobacillus mali (ex Roth et al. 2021)]
MRHARRNDTPAEDAPPLAEWMELYGGDVIRLAYSYVHNFHKAEDIAQDVFLRAWQHYGDFQGHSSIKTWLLSITANRARDVLRSGAERRELADEGEAFARQVEPTDPADVVADKLARDAVWRAIRALPETYREVMELYYGNDLTTHEVAEVLGIRDQTVRTRLHRGRQLLERALAEQGGIGVDQA